MNVRDDPAIDKMVGEIMAKHHAMDVCIEPHSMLQLVGLIQLALRHPGLSESDQETALCFVEAARDYFCDCPTVLQAIARGAKSIQQGRMQ